MPERRVLQPYEHDCPGCVWVGWLETNYGWSNVYFHPSAPHASVGGSPYGTIVVRYSSAPADYWSMPVGTTTKGGLTIRADDASRCSICHTKIRDGAFICPECQDEEKSRGEEEDEEES